MGSTYPAIQARYLVQEQARGQAHAVGLAEPYVHEPLLIMFIDTLFEADLDVLTEPPGDGAVLTHYVPDPERFGVVVSENGRITRFAEKSPVVVSHDAIAGVYVLKGPDQLFRAIRALMERGETRGGEYFLADALQLMVDEGAHLTPVPASVWQDTGTIEAILGSAGPPFQAHHYLLDQHARVEGACENSAVIPPVYLPASATISESVVGPYVSVGEGAVIRRSVVRESIIGHRAMVDSLYLVNSIVGDEATATGTMSELRISDYSSVTD